VVFGAGKLAELPAAVAELGGRRVLLVTGSQSMAESGARDRVLELLSGCEVAVHDGVRVNLPLEDADEIIRRAREHRADLVIGLGGGSVLDGAKAGALLAANGGFIRDYLGGGQTAGPGLPYISIPTTSGSGSEVTPFMIFMDNQKRRKVSYGPRQAMARVSIVDPELTLSLPMDQTAATGLDALSHCLESFWSKRATPLTDLMALEGITVILDHLEGAFFNGDDLEARVGMSYGSMVAGFALSQTATAALHGITYPLTASYGVTHGIACAFMMREVLRVNFHHLDPKKQVRLLHHMRVNTMDAAVEMLTDLMARLGVPDTLADLGISEREISRFVDEVTPAHLERNVAPLSPEKIREMWLRKVE
jgi:alcohol dehydrogenase class IV